MLLAINYVIFNMSMKAMKTMLRLRKELSKIQNSLLNSPLNKISHDTLIFNCMAIVEMPFYSSLISFQMIYERSHDHKLITLYYTGFIK